jgi:ATP-dependent DNA helicase DinG
MTSDAAYLATKIPGLVVLTGGKSAVEHDYIDEVFGPHGYLAARVDGYRPRDGQIKLARAIDRGIRDQRHVIGEGPTGTGKSFAYSVPAAYHAVHSGKKVCIVTANKNLQRQIYQKDLAALAAAVPWPFTYAIRKGVSSYLCLRDFESRSWQTLFSEVSEHGDMIRSTADWAAKTETGDFEESPGPPPKVWAGFSTSREECDGRKCVRFRDCYVKKAKDASEKAQIIVTNYHLFFLHLRMGTERPILPHFDVVIMDEAHRAANIARDFFGTEITFGALYRCVTNLHMIEVRGFRARGAALRDEYMAEVNRMWAVLGHRARSKSHILSERNSIETDRLEGMLNTISDFYDEVADVLDPPALAVLSGRKAAQGSLAAQYRKLSGKCAEKAEQLAEFRATAQEGMVYFIEGSGNEERGKYVRLKSRAVEVAGFMRPMLFERYKTVVQTSATLAVRGGKGSDFAYLRREMGMNPRAGAEDLSIEELVVESPFNWPKQAMLVIPASMPEFTHGDGKWDEAVLEHTVRTVTIMKGRTLGLFTSFRMLELAKERLRRETRYRILAQGEGTNRELVSEFQADIDSVLLGTESFAEGISVEGEACSCVLLDKIPFINKDDPVMAGLERRLKQRGSREDVFRSYMLPEAIISFKQRVGRLIRTVEDVGVVVVLDRRLLTKPYRTQFIKSIPPIRRETELEAIQPFLWEKGIV